MQPGLTCVIVVAADSGLGLVDAVAAALAGTAPVEMLVSDNASSDGSVDALRTRFSTDPRVRIVHNGANLGFGRGVNAVAGQAHSDLLLILNPDCFLAPDTVARIRAELDANPDVGLLGVRVVDAQGNVEPASRRRDPTLARSLRKLTGGAGEGVDLPPAEASAGIERVDAVSGALMAIRRDLFEKLGGFDEGYFLHCEDLDLCRRVRDAGHAVACANAISVVHGKGGSSRHRPVFVAWHKHRGMWRWFRKFDPAARNVLSAAVVWCGLWAHFGLQLPRLMLRRRAQR